MDKIANELEGSTKGLERAADSDGAPGTVVGDARGDVYLGPTARTDCFHRRTLVAKYSASVIVVNMNGFGAVVAGGVAVGRATKYGRWRCIWLLDGRGVGTHTHC